MAFNDAMMHDTVWFDRPKYEEEVANYQCFLSGHAVATATASTATSSDSGATLVNQIKEARSHIKQSLEAPAATKPAAAAKPQPEKDSAGIQALEKENQDLKKLVADLASRLAQLEVRVGKVEQGPAVAPVPVAAAAAKPAEKKPAPKKEDSDSDDPFGDDDDDEDSDEDDEETPAQKAHREKMEAAAKKKAEEKSAKGKKPPVVGKSEVTFDVKPWDDETDMGKLEECVRTVAMEGLLWGRSKLVPLAYGIMKLQIQCVVVDDLVSTEDVQEQIEAFDDYVQSTDIAAFNKI